MDNAFTIETQDFQGPLDKLLELVKEEKLDINKVSLSKVTGKFLEYVTELKKSEDVPHSTLADFLVVASKLLLLKSKVLIPSLELEKEEEEDIENLEIQLKIYSRVKEAEEKLKKAWQGNSPMAAREFLAGREVIFHPGKISVSDIKKAVLKIADEIKKLKPVEKIRREVINLRNKMEEVMKRITSAPAGLKTFFQTGGKNEVVVLFLVILHLFRDKKIDLEQKEQFGEIKIKKAE